METKNFVACGLLVGILFIVLDMFVAIATMPLMSLHMDSPVWKTPVDATAGVFFDLINGFILVGVYIVVSPSIPKEGWKKGAYYGAVVGLFRVVMSAFSTYVMYAVPTEIVLAQLAAGYLEIVALGVFVALICEKLSSKSPA